jgi:hypothetical protein
MHYRELNPVRCARADSGVVRIAAPGANQDAIRAALSAGLQLSGTSHLLASVPFGHMEQYVPSGPGLF